MHVYSVSGRQTNERQTRRKQIERILKRTAKRYTVWAGLLLLGIVTAVFGALSTPQHAAATPNFFVEWRDTIYTQTQGNLGNTGCRLCHLNTSGGDGWNAYGWSLRERIRNEGMTFAQAVAAVESLDADGNGVTNIDEINSQGQPGWTNGNTNTIYFRDDTTLTDQPVPEGVQFIEPAVDGIDNPIAEGIPTGDITVSLVTIADNLVSPLWGVAAQGLDNYLFVVDQPGQIWQINLLTGGKGIFLDISSSLVSLGIAGSGSFDERGLLGVAFAPDYATSGKLYTYASEPVEGVVDFSTMPDKTNPNHHSVLAEWMVDDPTNPNSTVNMSSKRILLRIDQPQFNHNGGALAFGPNGMLYVGLGDGGGADDDAEIGHSVGGNGQNAGNILGTILRIDPNGNDSANGQYGIPADNPFVNDSNRLNEIFAYGLRNPYRMSFDSVTGMLYTGDVGQNDIEEIDVITSGGNYGWPIKEGTFLFEQNGAAAGVVTQQSAGAPEGLIDPVAEYDHDEGLSAIGGFVYRGSAIPALQGRYVFGDWALSFSNPSGRLFYLDENNGINEFQLDGMADMGIFLHGFGQDANGELYVLGNTTGNPFPNDTGTNTGVVLRIGVPGATVDFDHSNQR
ncbi:MAG: PQQ-dependent sugar dehydrogenase, partial [Chloroflexota bacterium]